MNYEDAVRHLKADRLNQPLIEACYLDDDVRAAANRFHKSDEFQELLALTRLKDFDGRVVLDLGCGNGIASVAFALQGAFVVAADPDSSREVGLRALLAARQPDLVSSIEPCLAQGESLPFPDRQFDLVYLRQTVHHFRDPVKALSECRRVLRSTGKLLVCREHVAETPTELAHFLAAHPLHSLHGGENAYPVKKYQEFFRASGLVVERTLGPFDSVINHFPVANKEVRSWLEKRLTKLLGAKVSAYLARRQLVERLYRARLSRRSREPGRLFSFVCRPQ